MILITNTSCTQEHEFPKNIVVIARRAHCFYIYIDFTILSFSNSYLDIPKNKSLPYESSCNPPRPHPFSTYAKFSEKLIFSTPCYAHVRMELEILVFRKILHIY